MDWPISGIDTVSTPRGAVIVVSELSDDLKTHIRELMGQICHGSVFVKENPDHYSFRETVLEFLVRFESQSTKTQLGMVGEMFTHLFAEYAFPDMRNVSVYFNKEERSIKKGFDLTFYSDSDLLWYTEVKTGRLKTGAAGTKVAKLANTAARDLKEKLSGTHRKSIWASAIIDANIALGELQSATVKTILRRHSSEPGEHPHNVLVATGLIHPVSEDSISTVDIEALVDSIASRHTFAEIRLLAIQKSTVEKFIEFLKNEAAT